MAYQGLIHTYANLPKDLAKNPQPLMEFCRQYGQRNISDTTIPSGCYLRASTGGFQSYIAFFDQNHAKLWIDRQRNDLLDVSPMLTPTYPGQYAFEKVIKAIEKHCCKIRTILDQCIIGIPPKMVVSKILKNLIRTNVLGVIPTQVDAWHFSMTASTGGQLQLPLDLYVEMEGILLPSFKKSSIMLKHTRKCCVCGNYYQARGATVVHCSKTCRSQDRFDLKGRTKK